jgi:hypothetical protein
MILAMSTRFSRAGILIIAVAVTALMTIASVGTAGKAQAQSAGTYWCYNIETPKMLAFAKQLDEEEEPTIVSDQPVKCFKSPSYNQSECNRLRHADDDAIQGDVCHKISLSRPLDEGDGNFNCYAFKVPKVSGVSGSGTGYTCLPKVVFSEQECQDAADANGISGATCRERSLNRA